MADKERIIIDPSLAGYVTAIPTSDEVLSTYLDVLGVQTMDPNERPYGRLLDVQRPTVGLDAADQKSIKAEQQVTPALPAAPS